MPDDVIVPTRARGYTTHPSDGAFWSWVDRDHVPDLNWPTSVDVYRRMLRNPQVASVKNAVTQPLRKAQWRLDPAGARDAVVDLVAGDLNLPVLGRPQSRPTRLKGRFSWREHVRLAIGHLWQGAAFFEQEAAVREDGLAHLHRLGFRPLWTLAEPPKVAADGGLVSITQTGTMGRKSVEIPVRQLVAYVREREGGNWLGESVLRAAYEPWMLRDRLVRTDTIKNDRFGVGTPVYTSGREDGQDIGEGSTLMQSMRGGEEGGFAQPKGAISQILTPMGSIPDTLESIEYHDRKIAGVALGHWMNLGQQSGTGSYALGAVQVTQFNDALQTDLDDIRDVAQAHVVEDLVEWNFGPSEPVPRLVVDRISEKWTAQMLKLLVDAGILRPDRSTEEWVRDGIDAPEKDNTPEGTA